VLADEKALTRARDALNTQRRLLPMVEIEKDYRFEGPTGTNSLVDAFEGRHQLIVQHFMFDPSWDEGCKSCSFWADNFNGIPPHLRARDIAFVAISRAPLEKIEAYRKRMGWSFPWLSSFGTDFNRDLGVTFTDEEIASGRAPYNYTLQEFPDNEAPGVSVFYRDAAGAVYHTYSAYGRGIDILNGAYNYIDLVPKGRDEGDTTQRWVRRHDEY
jgi:predicted dithiol-disulfide oxidoreductase (DUF899 family)